MAETVLAATMLALLAISTLTLLPAVMGLVERNRQLNIANYLAHDTLEAFAARPFPTLVSGEQELGALVVPSPYRVTVFVAAIDGYSLERLKSIRVDVTWLYRDKTLSVQDELWVHAVRR